MARSKYIVLSAVIFIVIAVIVIMSLNRTLNKAKNTATKKSPQSTQNSSVFPYNKQKIVWFMNGSVKNLQSKKFELSTPSRGQLNTYIVLITDRTKFYRNAATIPYLFKKEVAGSEMKASQNDLKEGLNIEVRSLENYEDSEVEADSIVLPRLAYILQGTIVSRQKDSLIIDAAPVLETPLNNSNTPPPHSIYTVEITPETEISREIEKEKKKFTTDDLSESQQVVIYADRDVVDNKNITALRIEPIL